MRHSPAEGAIGTDPTWLERIAGLQPLDPSQRAQLTAEAVAVNLGRLRVLLPLMFGLHLVHVWLFWLSGDARAAAAPATVAWRDAVAATHGATALVALALIAWHTARDWVGGTRWIGPVAAAAYLLHAAAIAGVDQLNAPNVSPYMAYSIAIAFLVVLDPPALMAVFSVGLSAFFAAIFLMQPLADARMMLLPNGPSVTGASIALALFLYVGRRRDFTQRQTIDRQRTELERLNVDLAAKVEAQVAVIVSRAAEVDHLNAQLQEQVRDRSRELARALERLALHADIPQSMAHGTVLSDRFEVGDTIGSGGMGTVYAGVDRSTGEPVAIKVISASSAAPMAMLRRFLREARAAASVQHPAIVRMLKIDIADDGAFYQVQELVEGETLQATLVRRPQLPPDATIRLLAVLCDALAAAHAEGVIHRDIKPANLMLTRTAPGLKVLDFGISKVIEETVAPVGPGDELTPTLLPGDEETRVGVVLGTPKYMGPEQLSGSHNTTDKADIYAVGVVAFLALLGDHPTASEAGKQTPDPAPRADEIRSLPGGIGHLVEACLSREPTRRPTAAALASAFAALAEERAVPALQTLVARGAFHGVIDDGPTSYSGDL